jgi:nucleotide-binding universal stress UspA family protein
MIIGGTFGMTQLCPVSKLERVLLSTDGSEFSEGAIREAVKLARLYSSKLFVLSVIETNEEFETLAPRLVEEAEGRTRKHLEYVKSVASQEGLDCEIIARHSETPYQSVVEEAKKNHCDMIIMGRRGRTGLKRLLMGSVTAKVIGHSPCNVLVVPRAAKIDFRKILVATDGSQFSASAASEAVAIAKRCDIPLVVISVVPSEEASPFDIVHSEMQHGLVAQKELEQAQRNARELSEAAEKGGVRAESVVVGGRPYEAIVDTAKEKMVDLIVVGSHGRTGMERLLMGSVTERVVGHAECAVLVVKAANPGNN